VLEQVIRDAAAESEKPLARTKPLRSHR
jgi:hypothetical protein